VSEQSDIERVAVEAVGTWDFAPPMPHDPPPLERAEFREAGHYFRGKIDDRGELVVAYGAVGSGHYSGEIGPDMREWLWPWAYCVRRDTGAWLFVAQEFEYTAGTYRPLERWRQSGGDLAPESLWDVWQHVECLVEDWRDDWRQRRRTYKVQCLDGVARATGLAIEDLRRLCSWHNVWTSEPDEEGIQFVDTPALREALKSAIDCATAPVPYTQAAKPNTVYFVRAQSTGLIKIGCTNNVPARVKALRSMSGDALEILATMRGGITEERDLHRLFAAHRKHGEWFAPAPELLSYIAARRPWR
jgi:hypothetical protein